MNEDRPSDGDENQGCSGCSGCNAGTYEADDNGRSDPELPPTVEQAARKLDEAMAKQTEIVIKEAEIIKVNPQPGDVLFFKFKGNDFFNDDVQRLGDRLRKLFPNNKVIVMTLPEGHEVELTSVQENVTTEPVVVSASSSASTDCSQPTSYCNNCHCGKKEAIEGKKK